MRPIDPLEYPHPRAPAPGTAVEVAAGIHWLTMPIAHLYHLHYANRLLRTVGADGVARFAPA